MTTVIYGIKNCDTMKKAFAWLKDNGVEYQFHDYKKEGVSAELIDKFIAELGWEALVNKRGTTWRNLPDDVKENIDEASARSIMQEHTSIIKRPVLVHEGRYTLGFKADQYQEFFKTE